MEHEGEYRKALITLQSLAGETLPVLDLHCAGKHEAPLFARIVSKLSPLLGNVFEDRVTALLNADASPDYAWIRQDPDFPDALLTHKGVKTHTGFEIKAWYVHSTEITGRFRESVNLLQPRNVHVVIVAWTMDRIIHGQAKILGVQVTPALDIASTRDSKYHHPPTYLCVEPEDTTARTRNLQQSNVNGYRLQDTTAKELAAAAAYVAANRAAINAGSHSPAGVAVTRHMMQTWQYRLDTNFAKLDRIDEKTIEAFKTKMLGTKIADGRTAAQWTTILRDLTSDSPAKVLAAETKTVGLY